MVGVTIWAELVDLLMFPQLPISADDFELILCGIDETCLKNHGDNLNIDPIAEKYHTIEYVYFIDPWAAVILSSSIQCPELQMLLVGGRGHHVGFHLRDLFVRVVTFDDESRKRRKWHCDDILHRNTRIHVGQVLLNTAASVLESQTC